MLANDTDTEDSVNSVVSDLQSGKTGLISESVHDVNGFDSQACGYWAAVKKDSGFLYYFYDKKPSVSQIKNDYDAGKFAPSSAVSTIGQLKSDDKIYLIEGSDLDSYVANKEKPTIQDSNITLRNKIVFLKDVTQLQNNDNIGNENLYIDGIQSRYSSVYDILQNNSFLYYVENGESRETENLSPTYNTAEAGEKPEYIDDALTGKRYYLIGVSGNETGNLVEGDTVITYKYGLRNEDSGVGLNTSDGDNSGIVLKNGETAYVNEAPKTGDESKRGLFAGMLGISASVASIAFLKLLKKKTSYN